MGSRVQDKVCVVTGAAMGIGRAAAQRLFDEGARVALFDISDIEGRELVDQLDASGSRARYWHVDVADENSVASAMSAVATYFGGIDVLINNAGVAGRDAPTHELNSEDWDYVLAINVKGVFFCTKYAIPHLLRSRGAAIVNLSSIYGLVGAPDLPPYHASKGAVTLMTKTDALLYAHDGVRVNSLHPGFIWTPLVEQLVLDQGRSDFAEARIELGNRHPLGHVGTPDDVAWAVVFLASNEARFITGAALAVDGGYTCR